MNSIHQTLIPDTPTLPSKANKKIPSVLAAELCPERWRGDFEEESVKRHEAASAKGRTLALPTVGNSGVVRRRFLTPGRAGRRRGPQVGALPSTLGPAPATNKPGRADIYRIKMRISGRPGMAKQSVSNLAGWEFPFSGLPVEALFQISIAGEACDFT